MSQPAGIGPSLEELFQLFPPAHDQPDYQIVAADQVPQPYYQLLVHEAHMTVTVEAYHGDLVDVRVLAAMHSAEWYARKILLTLQKSGRVVQFGIVRVLLRHCSALVREEILAQQTPLGRILIKHDVLRRIEPTAYLRIMPGPSVQSWFELDRPRETYGRLGIIHCDDQPAVELLEIVAPA